MPQRLYFMRHGERADNVWKTFVDLSFDSEGNYVPQDINFPKEILKRTDGYKNFAMDPPLTEVGAFTSTLLGREYKHKGIKIHRVYSSPPLRCVQTAAAFIKGYGDDVELCIETGLFEYMTHKVYEKGHPSWMTMQDFKDAGYSIKETEQIIKGDELRYGESYDELYERSHKMVKALLERHPDENLMCIGHGITMECCTRLLTGKQPRSDEHRLHILLHSSYCANLEVVGKEDGTFEITGCPVRQLKVSPVDPFDSSVYFLNEEEIEEDIKRKVDLYRKYKAILE